MQLSLGYETGSTRPSAIEFTENSEKVFYHKNAKIAKGGLTLIKIISTLTGSAATTYFWSVGLETHGY